MKAHDVKLLMSKNSKFNSRGEQCDCACTGRVEIAAQWRGELSQVSVQALKPKHQKINSEHELVFAPQLGGKGAVLTASGLNVLGSFHNPRRITLHDDQEVIRKMIELGFLAVDSEKRQTELTPSLRTLSAWLHLTDRCNLRCSYCYLPHMREDMSLETGCVALDALFRSAVTNNFKQVIIKYSGGEPLLRYPLILDLHEYARTLAERHSLELDEVILSNGTLLTREIAATLKLLDIGLMISLDGYGDYHDLHRPYASGRGSFKDVAEAVEIALANGLIPNISVTVSSRTVDGLPEICSWILEHALSFTFNFYRENEFSASQEDMRLDEQKIINGMLSAFRVIENNLPSRSFLGGIIDRADLSAAHTHTCGVGQNYLVFDQNGQVAKCQMHIHKPVTDMSVADPLALIRSDKIGIQNLSVEEKDECKTCDWRYWCAGGCPLSTHRATGRYDIKSPNCNIYRILFPEALRLEGLRILKYQDNPEVVIAL
jgi:uncharacterized protein